MNQTTPFLPNLSPVGGKEIIARFDDGRLSSDGGVLLLREVETRLGIADLPGCLPTRRARSRQAQPHPGRYDPHPAVRPSPAATRTATTWTGWYGCRPDRRNPLASALLQGEPHRQHRRESGARTQIGERGKSGMAASSVAFVRFLFYRAQRPLSPYLVGPEPEG